jgi:hypothetical protein
MDGTCGREVAWCQRVSPTDPRVAKDSWERVPRLTVQRPSAQRLRPDRQRRRAMRSRTAPRRRRPGTRQSRPAGAQLDLPTTAIQDAIRHMHGCESRRVETVHVREEHQGEKVYLLARVGDWRVLVSRADACQIGRSDALPRRIAEQSATAWPRDDPVPRATDDRVELLARRRRACAARRAATARTDVPARRAAPGPRWPRPCWPCVAQRSSGTPCATCTRRRRADRGRTRRSGNA